MKLDTVSKKKLVVKKPPNDTGTDKEGRFSIFLAGSIEMGKAEQWQEKVQSALEDQDDLVIYNPRRDDWDSTWKQTIDDDNFYGQVKWEHDHLKMCDIIFLYFEASSKSPISLLELGLFAGEKEMIVVCPDGFWRKGNVEFVCKEYDIPLFNTLEDGIKELKKLVK